MSRHGLEKSYQEEDRSVLLKLQLLVGAINLEPDAG